MVSSKAAISSERSLPCCWHSPCRCLAVNSRYFQHCHVENIWKSSKIYRLSLVDWDAVWCQDPLQYVRLLRVWFPVRGTAIWNAEMPSVLRQTLVGREGARFPSSRRQCHGLSLRESWVESGRRKLSETTSFLVVLEFRTGFVDLQSSCFVARFEVLQRQFWISCKAIACCSGGGQDGQKIWATPIPKIQGSPKPPGEDQMGLLPRCGSGKIKQRVGCLPPRGFSLVPRWWWESSGTNLHRQWASGWFWYIVLIGEITTQRGWNIKYHQISSNQNSWWQCYNMLQCSYDVDIVMLCSYNCYAMLQYLQYLQYLQWWCDSNVIPMSQDQISSEASADVLLGLDLASLTDQVCPPRCATEGARTTRTTFTVNDSPFIYGSPYIMLKFFNETMRYILLYSILH